MVRIYIFLMRPYPTEAPFDFLTSYKSDIKKWGFGYFSIILNRKKLIYPNPHFFISKDKIASVGFKFQQNHQILTAYC